MIPSRMSLSARAIPKTFGCFLRLSPKPYILYFRTMTKNFRSVAVTVQGEVDPATLGVVMTHEHLSCDISVRSGNPDNYMRDIDLIAAELGHYRAAGGGAVFEVT